MKYIFFLLCIAFSSSYASSIFVFGDSHTREFAGIPNLSINHLGPITMNRMGRDQLNALDLRKFDVRNGDTIIFAFGEIDVRCHVARQRDLKNRDLDEIMQTLVSNYLQTILKNRALFHNLTCIVYSITPPTDNVYSSEYPRYGSLEERAQITKQMNVLLKSACIMNGIKFLDVHADFADEYGILIREFSDGNVHISHAHNEPIKRKLFELLIHWETQ